MKNERTEECEERKQGYTIMMMEKLEKLNFKNPCFMENLAEQNECSVNNKQISKRLRNKMAGGGKNKTG